MWASTLSQTCNPHSPVSRPVPRATTGNLVSSQCPMAPRYTASASSSPAPSRHPFIDRRREGYDRSRFVAFHCGRGKHREGAGLSSDEVLLQRTLRPGEINSRQHGRGRQRRLPITVRRAVTGKVKCEHAKSVVAKPASQRYPRVEVLALAVDEDRAVLIGTEKEASQNVGGGPPELNRDHSRDRC